MQLKFQADLTPRIRRLDISTKNLAVGSFIGDYKSVFKGHGIEFEGYRPYTLADDASLIDWKASMRSNNLLVREYMEERNLEIVFLLDVSNSMIFGSHQKLKFEYAAELVSSITNAIIQKGDGAGLVMFSDGVRNNVYANIGLKQYYLMLKNLVNLQYYGGACNLSQALYYANTNVKPHTILFIISDFIGAGNQWTVPMKIASKKFETVCFIVRDPRDNELPADVGEVVVEDPSSEKQLLMDVDSVKAAYKKQVEEDLKNLKKNFMKFGVEFIELDTSKPYVAPILRFFDMRRRKWR